MNKFMVIETKHCIIALLLALLVGIIIGRYVERESPLAAWVNQADISEFSPLIQF